MKPELLLLLLLLLSGAAAAPPPPLGLLLRTDSALRIGCFAPRSFAGSTFELFAMGSRVPVRSVPAEPQQHTVEFELDGAAAASRCYWCRYRSYNGSAWETSELSEGIAVNGTDDAGCSIPAAGTDPPLPCSPPLQLGTGTRGPCGSAAAPVAARLVPLFALVLSVVA